jgi:iron complex outermembrane receptor protein
VGGLVTAGIGTYDRGFAAGRYGGRLGRSTSYRVFGDGFNRDEFPGLLGQSAADWSMIHGGLRLDSDISAKDAITMEADGQNGTAGETASSVISVFPPLNALLNLRDRYSEWDVLSRWNHVASPQSETSLQVYFDRNTRGDTTYGFGINIFDVDFQHHIGWGSRNDFVWGLGYRLSSDSNMQTPRISFTPASENTQLFSAFFQDEITIRPDLLSLSVGTKIEHNDYTGLGLEPSARLAWTPNSRNTFWTAISQAERTPSRGDRGIGVTLEALPGPNNLPIVVGYAGNPHQKAEQETSLEAGYRAKLWKRLSLDSTAFFNDYGDLESIEPGTPQLQLGTIPYLLYLSHFGSLLYGETHGFEAFADWKVTPRWTLSPGYSFLTMHLHRRATSQDKTSAPSTAGSIPTHQAQLRSHLTLPRHWHWNTSACFVGPLPALAIPSYTRLDSNLTWQVGEQFSIGLVGQNLLRDRHFEYAGPDSSVESDYIKRSAYVKASWFF